MCAQTLRRARSDGRSSTITHRIFDIVVPSLLPDFEYDVFISYRHKDNKGACWVTEFVNALKTELGATFKEEVSIYFDENPHDGLLETHQVDETLRLKLKCLVFIPIISQTYCDPGSFAWKHEFLAFKAQSSEDRFGLKVKLPNGNVASRILPVRIHELDGADRQLLENQIGPLRSVDFIYQGPGVNRPLGPADAAEKNFKTGFHLWSQKFDRELTDVFIIQDEIAKAIVDQLEVTLYGIQVGPKERTHTPSYLQARCWLRCFFCNIYGATRLRRWSMPDTAWNPIRCLRMRGRSWAH